MSEREPMAFEDGADLHMAHGQVTSKGEIERATGAAEGFFFGTRKVNSWLQPLLTNVIWSK